jgi:hypothetical protein
LETEGKYLWVENKDGTLEFEGYLILEPKPAKGIVINMIDKIWAVR